MIRIAIVFLILLASVWLGTQLSHDSGYLLITINHWSLETTLAFAVFFLLLLFFLLHSFLIFLSHLIKTPSKFEQWRTRRRLRKAQAKTRQGLIEFSEGYWTQAKNHLIKALPDTDTPLLNYLTAARAAQEMGDHQLRDNYLRQAQQSMPEAKIAVELTQAQLQLANQQWEQALATLRHLQDLAPHHPYVLKLLLHLYQEIHDWPQLIKLLPELKKYKVIKDEALGHLQKQIYLHSLTDLIKQNTNPDQIQQFIHHLPKALAFDADMMANYSCYLINTKQNEQAETIIRQGLKHEFNDQLIELYGKLPGKEKQLAFAEGLLKKQPQSAALYLCLGRLSIQLNLWGKAKEYFEKSIQLKPSPDAYNELGQLLERLNDQSSACFAYHQGLLTILNT